MDIERRDRGSDIYEGGFGNILSNVASKLTGKTAKN